MLLHVATVKSLPVIALVARREAVNVAIIVRRRISKINVISKPTYLIMIRITNLKFQRLEFFHVYSPLETHILKSSLWTSEDEVHDNFGGNGRLGTS